MRLGVSKKDNDVSMADKEISDQAIVITPEGIDYGHPIRMTFRFLDHIESGCLM